TQESAVVLGDLDLDDGARVAWSDAAQGGVGLDLVARLRGCQVGNDAGDGGDDLKEIVLVDVLETDASRGVCLDARGVELQTQFLFRSGELIRSRLVLQPQLLELLAARFELGLSLYELLALTGGQFVESRLRHAISILGGQPGVSLGLHLKQRHAATTG